MNTARLEITRNGIDIPIEVDPMDDTTGIVTEDVTHKTLGLVYVAGQELALTRSERALAAEALHEANPQDTGSSRRPDPVTRREQDQAADIYFAQRMAR